MSVSDMSEGRRDMTPDVSAVKKNDNPCDTCGSLDPTYGSAAEVLVSWHQLYVCLECLDALATTSDKALRIARGLRPSPE